MRKIKLIWEFKGPDAKQTALHHEIHLKEFAHKENLDLDITGVEEVNELFYLAYLVVTEEVVFNVRDTLIPLRAEIFEDWQLHLGNKTNKSKHEEYTFNNTLIYTINFL